MSNMEQKSKWHTVGDAHINLNKMSSFLWSAGMLIIRLDGGSAALRMSDPDKKLHAGLCDAIGIVAIEKK